MLTYWAMFALPALAALMMETQNCTRRLTKQKRRLAPGW